MQIIQRNLQEIGKSYLISLPKEWINTFKLKKGSKIKMMATENGYLSIAPEFNETQEKKEATIEYDTFFKRKFIRKYFNGNEKITIEIPKIQKQKRKEIYDFLKRFISVQIIEDKESKIVVKSFKIEELSIEECLTRIYHLSIGLFEECETSNDKTIKKEIRDNMTRFYYLLVMQIRRFFNEGKFITKNNISILKCLDYRMVAEKIQRIAEILGELEIKKQSQKNLLSEISEIYSKSFLHFLNSKFEKAETVWSKLSLIDAKIKREKNKELEYIFKNIKQISSLIR